MIMIADDLSQPLPVEPGAPAALDAEALAPVGLAARIETVRAVLMMTASQTDTLLGCAQQIQGAYRKMAERLQSAPCPEAVLNLQAWLDSLQSELDWLATRYPISGNHADIAALQARLAKDQAKLLRLRSEAEQASKIAGQIAGVHVEVDRLTSDVAAISNTKQRCEALLATVKSSLVRLL